MINSTAFDYVNVLTKAADASYQREAILANNISNVDTPGYKRKDLNFEGVLSQELGRCKHQSLDKKISELDTSKLTANQSLSMSLHRTRNQVLCMACQEPSMRQVWLMKSLHYQMLPKQSQKMWG